MTLLACMVSGLLSHDLPAKLAQCPAKRLAHHQQTAAEAGTKAQETAQCRLSIFFAHQRQTGMEAGWRGAGDCSVPPVRPLCSPAIDGGGGGPGGAV